MLRGVRLVRRELADSSKHRKIKGSRVQEQGPNNLLDPGLFRGID
jgi:hypothetical protein